MLSHIRRDCLQLHEAPLHFDQTAAHAILGHWFASRPGVRQRVVLAGIDAIRSGQ